MRNCFMSYYLDTPFINGRVFDVFEPDEEVEIEDYSFFFVHGGGWRQGSRSGGIHILMQELSRRGYICASTDYRLDAKDSFEQISDIRESLDTFIGMLLKRKREPKIIIWGESAGAHLASLTAYAAPGELGEDVSKLKYPEIRAEKAILQATPYDILPYEGIMPQTWARLQDIAGGSYEQEPERFERLSLKNYIRQDNPVTFFIEAEYEHLFDSKFTRMIAAEHRRMNIDSQWKVYERVEHGFLHDLKRKMQIQAFEDMCLFAKGKLETSF